MAYSSPNWGGKTAFSALYSQTPDAKVTQQERDSDDIGRQRYLAAMRSPAPITWMSDHLREDQRLRGAVYVALKCLGDQAANSEVTFYRWHKDARLGADKDAREPLPRNHPAVKLILKPNPQETFGPWIRRNVNQFGLTGSAINWRVDNGFDRPIELWNVPTGCQIAGAITPQYPDGYFTIMPYFPGPMPLVPNVWSAGGVKVDARQMLVVRNPHPLVQMEGLSPLSACDTALDTLESIDRARMTKMRRGLNPGAVVKLDADVKYPTDAELTRIKQQLYQTVGGADKAGMTAVLGPGMDLQPWGDSSIEVGWTESWNQLTSFVLSIYGVTRSLAFMSEDASYAAHYAALQQFNLYSLTPLLKMFADAINSQVIHPFFGEDIWMELVPRRVDDVQLSETQLTNDLKVGARTINEVRVSRGYDMVPWGEERAWTANKPEGMEGETDPAPSEDPNVRKEKDDNEGTEGSLTTREILPHENDSKRYSLRNAG